MIPTKRRVFFSFHYQQDVWRTNQVRQSWRYQREAQREAFGFFDGSLWESSQRKGDESLKSLIREGMKNTSVTCVLSGSQTYSRRWVRYEIARSLVKGNGLLTVNIHKMANQQGYASAQGPNPLSCMGVYRTDDGRFLIAALDGNNRWVSYGDYTQAIELPAGWAKPTSRDVIPLSRYGQTYDYIDQAGRNNFSDWIALAASQVGR
tara:strand:+ start:4189 stop:4806 length:618 start_codon:yes stop_codon:yes gene_type:complete